MAKFKLDDHDRNIGIAYGCLIALIVLLMFLVLLEFGYFDANGSTSFVPNCVPMDLVCGNTGCKGDDTIVNGRVQEQYP